MKKLNLYSLAYTIKKTIAIGASGLALTSSTAWAEAYINPHEIPLSLWNKDKLCVVDFDQDGDIDIINYYQTIITQQENIGSVTEPLFAPEKVLANRSNIFQIEPLNSDNISCNGLLSSQSKVDIDNDGDLDLFNYSTDNAKRASPLRFFENIGSERVQKNNTFGLPTDGGNTFFTDIDNDGDFDVFFSEVDYFNETGPSDSGFYINIGSPTNPAFVKEDNSVGSFCDTRFGEAGTGGSVGAIADMNGDGQLDMICHQNLIILISENNREKREDVFQLSSGSDVPFGYKVNALDLNQDGQNKLSITYSDNTRIFKQVFHNGRLLSLKDEHTGSEWWQNNKASFESCGVSDDVRFLTDFDGDNDLDLFTPSGKSPIETLSLCENKGSVESPLGSSNITINLPENPSHKPTSINSLTFGDRNGDGNNDMLIVSDQVNFYENIGPSINPQFQYIGQTPYMEGEQWLDIDNDGKIESALISTVADEGSDLILFNKGKEAAIGIDAVIQDSSLVLAINRPSQTQLYRCDIKGACLPPILLPFVAKEISVSSGNFTKTTERDETVLATIDDHGLIDVRVFDEHLNLISHGKGGAAHSISIAAGQLDSDDADEFVVSFVQADNTVVAASVNFDMTVVGVTQIGEGKQPDVTVGKFLDTQGSFVLSYITPNNQLKVATLTGKGALINQHGGGAATYAKISKASLLPSTSRDDYVVSYLQPNGIGGVIGFSSEGAELGRLTGGSVKQPVVASGHFPTKENAGLAISMIQEDKKPAIVFLDNKGNHLATGIGSKKATVATVAKVVTGTLGESFEPSSTFKLGGILVYVSESGMPIWERFSSDGVKQ